MAWQSASIGEDIATERIQEDVVKSSSGKPAPPQLPPPRGDLKFRFPKYRVESSTRPSHAAGICSDVTEYILPEETSNKNYTRAWEASNTCHTSSRYYPLTIPGAICSPPPTPPPPPSTPLPRRWVEPGVGQELNGRVDQPQQSRVMRPKAARLPRSMPMMPTREEALGIPGTALPVSPSSPDRGGGRCHGHSHSRDKCRTDGGGNNYVNNDNKHRRPVRDQSCKRQKDRRRPDNGEQSKPESDGGSCCRDRGKSQRRSNRGEQSNSDIGSGNLSHTRDKRYSSGGNGYHSQEKKQWHSDRVKGRERPDSGENSLFVFDWR
uniref:Uncharacterized protein DDB_G0284459-like n=1 Tax=Crassostrea virginica TaxID=6565 RepID=A0A8B8AN31_CRAVI|nr:uncharacterized protein DDB_G0284459-like [Crassostrea virginica]